ncbi:MAG: hypothetical protein ACLRIQ_20625 [Blautia wexlerae]
MQRFIKTGEFMRKVLGQMDMPAAITGKISRKAGETGEKLLESDRQFIKL